MTIGFLVNPDLTYRTIEFELEEANQFLGGTTQDRVAVAFQEDGALYAALYSPQAKEHRAEPNPVASLARNTAATGNPAFLTDPTAAISGPVIFVAAEGDDDIASVIEAVKNSIRAVRTYQEDNEEDYRLWRAAVLNMGSHQD